MGLLAYKRCSKNSDLYLVALYRDIFERQTIHHSKELAFAFISIPIFSRCTVSFNNYSALCMAHSITLACFHVIELWWYLNLNLSSPASLKPQKKLHCIFTFCYIYNVHSNVRMATCCVDSLYKAQFAILMTSLKLTTASFWIHCRIFISENILFFLSIWTKTCQT